MCNKKQTITLNKQDKEVLSELIKSAYYKIDFNLDYIYKKAPKLIQLAKNCKLEKLVEEIENDYNS